MESFFLTKQNTLGVKSFKLSSNHNPTSWRPSFIAANPNDPKIQSWLQHDIGFAVADLLGTYGIHFDSVDCLRRPRACLRLQEQFLAIADDHSVVITMREWPPVVDENILMEVMEKIYHLAGNSFTEMPTTTFNLIDLINLIVSTDRNIGNMTVEIRPGRVGLFSACPSVGSSIGPSGESNTNGTLGGFVDLVDKNGKVVAECALTADHVVRPYVNAANKNEMPWPTETSSGRYYTRHYTRHVEDTTSQKFHTDRRILPQNNTCASSILAEEFHQSTAPAPVSPHT